MLEIISRGSLPANLELDPVKTFLRVYDTEHDSTISLLIDAAIEFIQTYTRQTFRVTQYRFTTEIQPIVLPRFPVISVDVIEKTVDASFEALNESDRNAYEVGSSTPPTLDGLSLASAIRVTWTAGYAAADWPADLILLVWQIVEENFGHRGTTPANAQAAQFSRAHKLALEQYCTHHDAVR